MPLLVIHVGTCFSDDRDVQAQHVLRLELNESDGSLAIAGEPIKTPKANPGWLTIQQKGVVYAAHENDEGFLQAYTVCPTGFLEPLGTGVPSVGRHPCYTVLDRSGVWLFSAKYKFAALL